MNINGKLKSSFQVNGDNDPLMGLMSESATRTSTLYKQTQELIQVEDQKVVDVSDSMDAGDYKLRFSFQLPEDIPSSLRIKAKKDLTLSD